MHSSGRGEESPEAYRGVVLPSAQQQPVRYGDQVQPVGGTPWGAPVSAPEAPRTPEPADATQVLPPYPAAMPPVPGRGPVAGPAPLPGPAVPHGGPGGSGGPAPVADATQMLPPYPGAEPVTPVTPVGPLTPAGPMMPPPHAGPAPVPPLPPMPAQAPPSGAGPIPRAGDGLDATRAQERPLSIFEERPAYEQEPAPQDHDTRYGPGPGPDHGEYGAYREPQVPVPHDSDYDHLFRNDVPAPAPLRQRIIQPPDRQQPGPGQTPVPVPGPVPGQAPGMPPYGPQGHEAGAGAGAGYGGKAPAGGGRRLSPKVLIGIVVAGCVVAGLVVGGLLNSGGSASADNPGAKGATPSTGTGASAAASAGPDGTAADPARQQAQALDSLLQTSGDSRSAVVNAVESVKNCGDLPAAATALRSAAGRRTGLVTRLTSLPVDRLSGHADLTDALTKAWQASAAADTHYANWADQAQHNPKVCKGGHARITPETQAGNRESGTATQQKKRAVRLWNAIAKQYGLTQRQFGQL
jgi:hypothetical protein